MSSFYHLAYIYPLSIQVLWSPHLRSYLSNLGRNQEDPPYLVYLNLIGNTLNANRQLSGIKWDRWAGPNYDNIFFALFFIYAWDFKNIAVLFPFFVTQHTHVPIRQVPIEGQQNSIPKKMLFRWSVMLEKVLFWTEQNSQEDTCAKVSFLIKLQAEALFLIFSRS